MDVVIKINLHDERLTRSIVQTHDERHASRCVVGNEKYRTLCILTHGLSQTGRQTNSQLLLGGSTAATAGRSTRFGLIDDR